MSGSAVAVEELTEEEEAAVEEAARWLRWAYANVGWSPAAGARSQERRFPRYPEGKSPDAIVERATDDWRRAAALLNRAHERAQEGDEMPEQEGTEDRKTTGQRRREFVRHWLKADPEAPMETIYEALPDHLGGIKASSFSVDYYYPVRREVVGGQASPERNGGRPAKEGKQSGAEKRSGAKQAPTASESRNTPYGDPPEVGRASGGRPLTNGGDAELTAMNAAVEALEGLDEPVAARVAAYLYDRYGRS